MNVDNIIARIPNQTADARSTTRANASKWLSGGSDDQKAAAAKLIAALDAFEAAQREAMTARLNGLPVARRVVEAFTVKPLTEYERKLVQALLDNPGSTTTELTLASGSGRNMVWQMHFGNMCKDRQTYLWPAQKAEKRDGFFYCGILADADEPANRFTMKPDVASAFVELGVRPSRAAAKGKNA